MHDIAITGGTVLTADGPKRLDVGIADGTITTLGDDPAASTVIDATDRWVGPGLVDIHTHLRDPGQEWKEDIATGTRAAAAGGYTAVLAMPNTDPVVDNAQGVRYVQEKASRVAATAVHQAGAITLGLEGRHMAHIDEMWEAGTRVFTDDGRTVVDAAVLRLAMDYIAGLGGVVAQHAVDAALSAHGYMHEGSVSSMLGMLGIPAEAEEVVLARDLALARLTGVRYHAQHVSTARGVELIAAAKDAGVAVTAEVTPHHLMFDHRDVATADPMFKMMPPLRTPADVEALRGALRDGVIDVIATDHAPHAPHEKDVPFEHAPNGVTGLEWAAAVGVAVLGDIERFFSAMSTVPAAIAGMEGQGAPLAKGGAAHVTVVDPAASWTASATLSKSRNSPYIGRDMTGRVTATIVAGAVAFEA